MTAEKQMAHMFIITEIATIVIYVAITVVDWLDSMNYMSGQNHRNYFVILVFWLKAHICCQVESVLAYSLLQG